MKNIVQLFICIVVLAHGTLLSEEIGQIATDDATFTCEYYTSVDQSLYLSRESFDNFLSIIIKNGSPQIQKELDNSESTFTIGQMSMSEYITAYYEQAYTRFEHGENQACILLNQEKECMAIIFFSVDESFDKALYLERQIVLASANQINSTKVPPLLNDMTKLIAEKICVDAKQIITALPKGAQLLASFMQRVALFSLCEYTGTDINLEEKVVYAKLIAR